MNDLSTISTIDAIEGHGIAADGRRDTARVFRRAMRHSRRVRVLRVAIPADSAAQDITKPDVVELHGVRAKIEAEDKSIMNLAAADGLFNRKTGMLTLGRDIVLESTSGFAVRLSEAVIDTGSGNIVSNKPIEVKMLQGTLNANRLEVIKAGDVIQFGGGVIMDIAGGALESEQTGGGQR